MNRPSVVMPTVDPEAERRRKQAEAEAAAEAEKKRIADEETAAAAARNLRGRRAFLSEAGELGFPAKLGA